MFRLFGFLAIILSCSWVALAGADDDYIEIYRLIQKADSYRDGGQPAQAREAYAAAQKRLNALQNDYPTWNERVVAYRLRYIAEKLSSLPAATAETPGTATNAPVNLATLAPEGEVITQFNELTRQIGQLAKDKQILEAKLREALTAQPAPVDPRELQQAVEKITQLQSTNQVLVTQLEQQQAERRNLVEKVVADEARAALNEANRQLLAQKIAATNATREKTDLEAELKRLRDGELKQLKTENSTLKSQVTELRSDTERGRQIADLTARLGKLQGRLDDADRAREVLAADKARLEKQLDDYRARQSEEGIVKLHKLETDLAIAKAEASRHAAQAEEISSQLVIERSAHAKLEKENQSLAERVTTLTRELASAKSLEAALAAEKAERLELETQLKLAEQRLQAARTPPPPAAPTNHVPSISSTNTAPTADPGALIQVKMLEGEVGRLRETLKDSRDRETELKSLLAEAETQRLKLDAEKTQLMARLKETEKSAAAAIAASPSVRAEKTITTLELRVRELEKQRELLERKLASAANRSLVQIASERRLRGLTPRERAAETHLGR